MFLALFLISLNLSQGSSFKNLALEMQEIGADSIAIKDMSGILLPEVAYELVSALKSVLRVPVEVHTHATAGLASMTYLRAIEAGADIVDTAISPLSGRKLLNQLQKVLLELYKELKEKQDLI